MALGEAYASPSDLEDRLGRPDEGTYPSLLTAASRAVEAFTRRQFNKTTTATGRLFRAIDARRLPVDDFHTLTDLAIDVDGTAWTVDDVDPRPWNGVVEGQPGWPYFDLIAVSKSWPCNRRATVTVTAQWGWPEVPDAVVAATLDVASVMSYGSATAGFPVASEAIDTYRVSYAVPVGSAGSVPPELQKVLPYRRTRFGIA